MGKREYVFNREIRQRLAPHGFNFYRVENHGIDPGMPDIHFITNDGLTGWIEVKDDIGSNGVPKRIKYETQQVPWLVEYDQRGGFCCTIIRYTLEGQNWMDVVAGKDSVLAVKDLRATETATFDPHTNEGWYGLAELLKDGCRRKLWKQYKMIPAVPGSFIRESQRQDLVGAFARKHRSL